VQAAFRYGVFPKYHRKSLREKGLARQGDSSILTVDNLGMEGRSVMSRQDPLYAWMQELTKTFPDLSKPQLKGLAEWTFGMILARCCSLDSVASYLATGWNSRNSPSAAVCASGICPPTASPGASAETSGRNCRSTLAS